MKPPSALEAYRLEWVQPRSLEDLFELRVGSEVLATLTWKGLLGNLAQVETAEAVWTLEQLGVLNQRVEARELGSGQLVATYYPGCLGSGVVELAGGRELKWHSTNFWGTDWAFSDSIGRQPVALQEGVEGERWRDMLKTQYTVSLDEAGWDHTELALLAALGLYLIVWQRRAAAGAVAATAAVVG